jgi:hypothetical protein
MAIAPPVSHIVLARPFADVTRPAKSSAAYEASTAIVTDNATSR